MTQAAWNPLDSAPDGTNLVVVDDVKVVWVGNMDGDGTTVWHGVFYPRN